VTGRILAAVAGAVGSPIADVRSVAGGDVNRALRVVLDDGRVLFVKHRDGMPGDVYRAEGEGLAWLAEAQALRLPEVVAVGAGEPAFLALEWIERGDPGPDRDERLGRGLAALHASGADTFGLPQDNWIASLPQPNAPCATWPEFYAQRRLAPLARRAVTAGLLPSSTLDRVDRLADRLPDLCGPAEPPARLHGDLWGGNAMTGSAGEPVLIDPAVYGGHREMDLAMMRLFGGFSARVFAAYEDAFPLAPGHAERVELYQLYPLLVHVVLFGGGYAASFGRALVRCSPRKTAL
jgi:fructosamine-3-kinase